MVKKEREERESSEELTSRCEAARSWYGRQHFTGKYGRCQGIKKACELFNLRPKDLGVLLKEST
jgi:hypothetical protein